MDIISKVSLDFRVKSYESIENKYERYYPNTQVFKVFNDILGFRAFCDDYSYLIDNSSQLFRVVDMSKGKANDDGYRGVHLYYQVDNNHYPIEIQFNTLYDRQLNNWLHDYLYKNDYPPELGIELRKRYEHGEILSEKDFTGVLYNDLLGCKE